jgi:hypothetical protein
VASAQLPEKKAGENSPPLVSNPHFSFFNYLIETPRLLTYHLLTHLSSIQYNRNTPCRALCRHQRSSLKKKEGKTPPLL